MPIRVTVCVGSSCHIKGSRALLKRFSGLMGEHGLENDVVLLGSFCMERCGEGMNWRIEDEDISSATVEEAEASFRTKVLDAVKKA